MSDCKLSVSGRQATWTPQRRENASQAQKNAWARRKHLPPPRQPSKNRPDPVLQIFEDCVLALLGQERRIEMVATNCEGLESMTSFAPKFRADAGVFRDAARSLMDAIELRRSIVLQINEACDEMQAPTASETNRGPDE